MDMRCLHCMSACVVVYLVVFFITMIVYLIHKKNVFMVSSIAFNSCNQSWFDPKIINLWKTDPIFSISGIVCFLNKGLTNCFRAMETVCIAILLSFTTMQGSPYNVGFLLKIFVFLFISYGNFVMKKL